jgi:hypothetical protein
MTATDSAGNTATKDVNITFTTPAAPVVTLNPAALTTNRPTAGAASASTTASASGGTGGFTYAWSRLTGSRIAVSGTQTATFSVSLGWSENLTESFRMTATDSSGNVTTRDIAVTFTTPPALALWVDTSDPDAGVYRSTLCAHPSGGSGTYSYSWSKSSGNLYFSTATNGQCVTMTGQSQICAVTNDVQVVVTDSYGNQIAGNAIAALPPGNPSKCDWL